MYVQTEMDYEKCVKSNELIGLIKSAEEKLRPTFSPMWTEQDILGWRNELELLEWTYEEPVSINKNKEDYEW